ncbi:MAG TPA: DUF6335 family protein [Methylomirabilota bacterium]|nr:DUF6335 family protein [Methylomirabilota bacterium]
MSKPKPKPKRKRAATRSGRKKVKTKRSAAPARRGKSRPRKRTPATRRSRMGGEDTARTVSLLRDVIEHHETGPAVSAGDVDADWQRAQSSGEEAAGGSVATPDQDRVDEIGHALGVEQPSTAPLRTSEEILGDRDRRYWELERRAQRKSARRREP